MKLNKTQAVKLIKETNGLIFGVTFIKKDLSIRNMCARLGVRKGVKGVVNRAEEDREQNLLTVFDFNKRAFRRINLDTIQRIKFREEYEVE